MRILLVLIAILHLGACSTTNKISHTKYISNNLKLDNNASIYINTTRNQHVIYKGLINYDDIQVASNSQLYPGNSGAIFLASIFAHAAAVESTKKNRKKKLEIEAKKIAKPITLKMKGFTLRALVNSSISALNKKNTLSVDFSSNKDIPHGWSLKSKPIFYITKDLSTLVLKNSISIYSHSSPNKIFYQNQTENISPPYKKVDHQELWETDHGQQLKDISEKLFSESLTTVINDIMSDQKNKNKQATFKYQLGDKKEFERGYLINQNCKNTTIRTLRGWLKTFPNSNKNDDLNNQLEC